MRAVALAPGERIELDGILDEDVWRRTQPATDFIQQEPINGAAATERTEVRIVYTPDRLYLGVLCFDSDPDGVLGFVKRRDEFLGSCGCSIRFSKNGPGTASESVPLEQ